MTELLLWVNENDQVIGYGEKIETHVKKKLHRAFSIFIIDRVHKKILLQKRAKAGSKYFVLPILLYFLMAVLATVFSVDHSFSLSCKTEQAETIWVIGAYLIVFWY